MQSSGRHAFAGYPAAVLYRQPSKKSPVQQLLWGDWLRILKRRRDGWWFVHSRGCDGWIQEKLVEHERLLEIVFVDVGQGDGCLLVTPEDEHLLVDCGQRRELSGDGLAVLVGEFAFLGGGGPDAWRLEGQRPGRVFGDASVS